MQFVRATRRCPVSAFRDDCPCVRAAGQQNSRASRKAQGRQSKVRRHPHNSSASGQPQRPQHADSNSRSNRRQQHDNPLNSSSSGSNRLSNSGRNSSRSNVPSRPGNNSNRSVRSSRQSRGNSSGDGYSRAAGRGIVHGSRVVLNGGKASIAPGRSVEAMAVTTFLRTASVSISGVNTGSGCTAAPRSTWGIRASRTAAFRSCSWIPGRNTGQKTGTTPMTSTSIMTTGTTFTTAGIRASDLRSLSYCS